ncbi:hypothetical protein N482_13095 [Pseudoalteromonas luteoviolacea NCIMB 1942]|uniref:Uncharacterized protein n=1 Tax=Pseudoalteromonas luteoviolacea NCIMB 1942 TaxID=1365253 RepID=A0A167AZ52_9GAMM|nr:hypothetical protein N482_13095 [Pseudoalteromonas luteoviolacea NCIMB 1942]
MFKLNKSMVTTVALTLGTLALINNVRALRSVKRMIG